MDDLAVALQTLAMLRERDVAESEVLKFIDALVSKNLYLGCFIDFVAVMSNYEQLSTTYYSTYIGK